MSDRPSIHTNRDLYRFAVALAARRGQHPRSLPDWIAAFHGLLRASAGAPTVPADAFASALDRAFEAPCDAIEAGSTPVADLFGKQLADLRLGEARGSFDNPMRFFGAQIPGGGYWYNWTPSAYIECGIQGAFGGWTPGDPGGRALVPGDVAVVAPDGSIQAVPAAELVDDEAEPLTELTWEQIRDFGECGQSYE